MKKEYDISGRSVKTPILIGAGVIVLLLLGLLATLIIWGMGQSSGYNEAYKKCYDNEHPEQQLTNDRIIVASLFILSCGLAAGFLFHGPPLQFKSITETNINLGEEEEDDD